MTEESEPTRADKTCDVARGIPRRIAASTQRYWRRSGQVIASGDQRSSSTVPVISAISEARNIGWPQRRGFAILPSAS
jgi:hypothetical protein